MYRWIVIWTWLLGSAGMGYAQFQHETRQVLMSGKRVIQVGDSVSADVTFHCSQNENTRKYLRIVGGGQLPGRFKERGETLFRDMEYQIDDCLDSLQTKRDRYALCLQSEGESFEQCAYNRIAGERLGAGRLEMEVYAQSENLQLFEDGYVGVELQVYYPKPGRNPQDIYDVPDTVLVTVLPSGTYSYKKFKYAFTLTEEPATVLLKVGGKSFSGLCWLEAPIIRSAGNTIDNLAFTPYDQRPDKVNYWVGVNLVSKCWPVWSLKFDGKGIFNGKVFDRASNVADFYIPLPDNLPEKGKITLILKDEAHKGHVPYEMISMEIIEESANDFEIVSLPHYVAIGDTAGVLIEINKPGIELVLTSNGHYEWLPQSLYFTDTGLYVLRLRACEVGTDIPVTVSDGKEERTVCISSILHRQGQRVYLSSGDEIYIDKVPAVYDYFFKWYFKSRLGNWYQFRPSYQWSGFRQVDDKVMSRYFQLLNEMSVPFAWQVEGRTLAGGGINPSLSLLYSPMFKGKQAHENDGGYYYWQHFQDEGLFTDIRARYLPLGGIFAKHRPIYTDKGKFVHYDPYGAKDMADGAETFVRHLAGSRGESIRHTGPSTMFRYLFQAGYQWAGAEQMYGPEETIMSALRGASRAYGKQDYGSLHAMQWGSSPFTTPEHALRLYLSLATAYMHGSSHLNTEEALWTDEYANDRYSESGKQHQYAQNQMLDYIETHSRLGKLKTNIAVLQGRNCSWKCFGRTSMWSQKGEKWQFDKVNESFDLLHVFYPDNILDACAPEGWFTLTPYGSVDILPIEADDRVMQQYRVLVFLGWNTFHADDFRRIRRFVEQGGTLVLSAAHLNKNLQPDEVPAFPENDQEICLLLGDNYRSLKSKTEIDRGKGRVIYYPQVLYPSESGIRADYEKTLHELAEAEVVNEVAKGYAKVDQKVSFTVWDTPLKRTIYFLNIDWASGQKMHQAELMLGNKHFSVNVRPYQLETLHIACGLAVLPLSNTTDILSIEKDGEGWMIMVQTTGMDTLRVFNSISGEVLEYAITNSGVSTLKIDNNDVTTDNLN